MRTLPGSSTPGNGPADGTRPERSPEDPTSTPLESPLRNALIVVAAVDVSIVIDEFCWASARYWSMLPGVSGMAWARPSESIRLIQAYTLWVTGLSKVALVASPSRPLFLLTTVWPAPLIHDSTNHSSSLSASGAFFDTPAALSFFATCSIWSRVFGGLVGSSPARRKWLTLKYRTGSDTFT